jgi:myo-inositol-1(or 4)-monophosphatase
MQNNIFSKKDLEDFINSLLKKSTKIVKQYFRTSFNIELKSDHSPVTIADKKIEEMMREEIMRSLPDHGILGEEFGIYQPQASYQWILDPIDGTKSFICGVPTFGTLIALLKEGIPQIGAIHLPVLDELLIGDGKTTEMNGRRVKMRECSKLSDAVLLTTDHVQIAEYKNIDNFNQLIKKVSLYRTWGDCFGYYLLASGYADIMVDPVMSKWDSMALIPIINGANGRITDYEGNDPVSGNSIVAANARLHENVVHILNS